MPEDAQRLRFAIGVFYDGDRLLRTLTDFWQLGLTAKDMWIAGRQQAVENAMTLLTSQNEVKTLTDAIAVVGASETLDANGFVETLMTGEIGGILQDHIDKGGIVLATKIYSPTRHDQCLRILLRTSLHKVFSQDHPLGLPLSKKAHS